MGFPVVNRNNREYILAQQSKVYPSDIFDTNGTSIVEITLLDNTQISIGIKTHFVLHNLHQNGQATTIELNLGKGTMQTILKDQQTLELGTPLATVVVKGGGFYARYAASTLEIVMLEEGAMKVSNGNGNANINSPSHGTTVIAGSAPQIPTLWSNRKIQRLIKQTFIE